MQIILHAGAHCTDEDRLVKSLLRNHDGFLKHRIVAPGPSNYRQLLRETINALDEGRPDPDAREVLVEAFCNERPENIDRLLLSNDNFFAVPKIALSRGELYPMAVKRLAYLQDLFPEDGVELFLAMRDPASWLPALFDAAPQKDFASFLDGVDPESFRWSDFLLRLRAEVPELPITVWCNEDTPFIWGEIIRTMAGLDEDEKISGAFDLLSEIMAPEGMQRFRAYLKEHPVMTEAQKRRVMTAFLDKYYLEEEMEEELDLPGWSEDLMARLTEGYEADVARIAQMDGIRFIAP